MAQVVLIVPGAVEGVAEVDQLDAVLINPILKARVLGLGQIRRKWSEAARYMLGTSMGLLTGVFNIMSRNATRPLSTA